MHSVVHIVEDDPQYSNLLKEMAEQFGWQCQVHTDAKRFTRNIPSKGILILDLAMPDMDGIEVITKLKEAKSELMVILNSGMDESMLLCAETLATSNNITVLGCLQKPTPLHELIRLLEKAKETKPQTT
ncbi:MAG: response regulator [Alteromonadaceae bacterium]|nr:response regulator [Alteromonadaceae bacterium]